MNKLKLIHNKDKFVLEINDNPIKYISYYKIETKSYDDIELTIKTSIDMKKSSIDIEKSDINLR